MQVELVDRARRGDREAFGVLAAGAVDAGLTRMRSRVQRSGVPTGDLNRRRLTIADLLGEGSDDGSRTASPVSQQPVASGPASVIIAQAESGEA